MVCYTNYGAKPPVHIRLVGVQLSAEQEGRWRIYLAAFLYENVLQPQCMRQTCAYNDFDHMVTSYFS